MMSNTIAEEFEKRQNIKAKTATTITTGTRHDDAADAMSWFAKWKLKEQNAIYGLDTGKSDGSTAWTFVKSTIPAYEDISENIDKILGDSDLMKDINELAIRDTKDLYVRELLNRLHKIIDYCDNWKIVDQVDYDIKSHMDYIVEMARSRNK